MKLKLVKYFYIIAITVIPHTKAIVIEKNDSTYNVEECEGCNMKTNRVLTSNDCIFKFQHAAIEKLFEEIPFQLQCVVPKKINIKFETDNHNYNSDSIELYEKKKLLIPLMLHKKENESEFDSFRDSLLAENPKNILNVAFNSPKIPDSIYSIINERKKVSIQDIESKHNQLYNVYLSIPIIEKESLIIL